MRITNSMMRNNSLWSINKNEEMMNKYETQLSSGKKIQKPSDDPVVAVRALKFRANIKEITQYKTNSEDATSWLSVNEQAMVNTISMLKRSRDLCVQGASDTFTTGDRESMVTEIEQLKAQIMNEGNVNYAGRHIFTGFKTDIPLAFTKNTTVSYNITESLEKKDIEKMAKVVEVTAGQYEIQDINRLRLAYSNLSATPVPISNAAGDPFENFTITVLDSTATNAYKPVQDEVIFLKDTGELIFNANNVNGTLGAQPIPANIDCTYNKASFNKGDMVPENYFDCTNFSVTPNKTYTKPNDQMLYQISYNQDMGVNTMGHQVFTSDLVRDFEELINAVKSVPTDGSSQQALQEDVLGDYFEGMLTKLDKHINTFVKQEAIIGSKINRLELTINRLDDDKINFTELMSKNEDVDMTEAVLNLKSQEIIYNASLSSSGMLLQKSLIDFIR